jgi:DNA polymerase IV
VVTRTILHVDLDAFFVSAEQARDPSLIGKAVIVGGDPDGRGVVATASYEARKFGVHSAMPLRTAKRLAPEAVFLHGDGAYYQDLSRRFHGTLDHYSPLVESGGLDEAFLDITGCEALLGTPRQAAAAIRRQIRDELTLPASVGIASSRIVAKVASDRAKPDGVFDVPPGEEAAFLAPMPLRALPMLGPSMEKRLNQLGIVTLGQVAALPAHTLQALFGRLGPEVAMRARGVDPTPVGSSAAAKSISREGTFSSDVADPARLRAVLRGFCESVGSQLRTSGRRARTVSLKLRFGDFTTISRGLTLGRPASSDEAIFAAAAALLDEARRIDPRAVRLIGVGLSNIVEDSVQLALEPGLDEKQESLSKAIDRIRARYGRRSLETGRTAFDKVTASDRWRHEKSVGLSSQMSEGIRRKRE